MKAVAAENPGTGTDDDHIQRVVQRERPSDAERRLDVRMGDDGTPAAPLEREIEPRMTSDCCSWPVIAALKGPRHIYCM